MVPTKVVRRRRSVESFDADWEFRPGEEPDVQPGGYDGYDDDEGWRELNIPHDWSIEEPFASDNPSGGAGGFACGGVGWYRKSFRVPASHARKRTYIQFDGIYHGSDVWVNGEHLGTRPYGYASFEYDLTPYLRYGGANIIKVRVDNSDQPNCRWYTGSGIYRHVWLTTTDPMHIAHWGTYVTTPEVSAASATVRIATTLQNSGGEARECVLVTAIVNRSNACVGTVSSEVTVQPGQELELTQDLVVAQPRLWSPETPALLAAHTRVYCAGELLDRVVTTFGIRHIRFDASEGFFLNGSSLKMKGVNYHQDAGCLGSAVPEGVLRRRLRILKGLGCNAIRMSHNPPAPEFLTLCDEMGFLVIDEAFDKWHSGSYGKVFEEWWERDLDAMIRRDRNHPCIVLWSVGNEVEDQGTDRQVATLKMLTDYVRQHEPTRPVTCVFFPPFDLDREARHAQMSRMAPHVDVLGLNYYEQWYEDLRTFVGDKAIIGTETFPYFRGRGEKMISYEPMNPWFDTAQKSYVAGGFIWPGYDYLGESSAWPVKGWPAGILDTCGFLKPLAYFFQSVWSDKPVVSIAVCDDTMKMPRQGLLWSAPRMASHWNFPHFENQLVRLVTYTNCEQVSLFVNDKWVQTKALSEFPDKMMTWYVPYEAGTIRAVGMRDGQESCVFELKTAGEAVAIECTPDVEVVRANGLDVFHVEVRAVDANGVTVPSAEHPIHFSVEGPGCLIGLDNGDLECSDDFKGTERRLHFGRCLAIVQSTGDEGEIELVARAAGLTSACVSVRAMPRG